MALTQLVSRGLQDEDLTLANKPATSPFAKVFKRHAPYAIESIESVLDGTVNFGQRLACTVSRRGDLVMGMHLEITLRKKGNTYFPAEQLVELVELQLGKVPFETLTSDWLRCRQELFASSDEKAAYARLTDFVDGEEDGAIKTFFLSLPFYFHNKPHLAVPLIAAQYHTCTVFINLAQAERIAGIDPEFPPQVRFFADYAFLGTWERRLVARSEHQMVVEQLQFQVSPCALDTSPKLHKIPLAFNHPCRWLAWHMGSPKFPNRYTATLPGETREALGPVSSATLLLNGSERWQPRSGPYFNSFQPALYLRGCSQPCAGLYFYSFSRSPLDPDLDTGDSSLNFSRIDAPIFTFTSKAANVGPEDVVLDPSASIARTALELRHMVFYTSNFNVLIVKSGMFTLKYAN